MSQRCCTKIILCIDVRAPIQKFGSFFNLAFYDEIVERCFACY